MIEVITIARFGDAITANLAKQDLKAEGITAFLADEITVDIAWHWTVAVGWIKLQVPEPEVERAMSILATIKVGNQFSSNDSDAFTPEGALSLDLSTLDSEDDDDIVRLSWADRTVERMFRVAILGIILLPLHLYSLWLLIRLLVSRRPVTRSKYWKVVITIIFNAPIMAALGVIFL